jgi:hypothetical protein
LVGSFRATEVEDAEVLTRGLTALLGSYPEFVVRAVCDPRSGLPATSKFFPTLYEVRSACEAKLRPILEDERRRRIQAENAADRPAEVSQDEAAKRKAFIANWRARQALRDAVAAGQDTPLADLDARKLHGKHKELVTKAIENRLERLKAECASSPVTLSDSALATAACIPLGAE